MEKILQNHKITASYTDGAFSSKTRIGGWAYIFVDNKGEIIFQDSAFEKETTNNRMEMIGVIESMKRILTLNVDYDISIFSDSKYLVDGINKWIHGWSLNNWKTYSKNDVKNKDLWIEMKDLKVKLTNVSIQWIKGHADNKYNNFVDKIASNLTKNT